MAIIKVKRDTYSGESYLHNLCCYIEKKNINGETVYPVDVGGNGVNFYSAADVQNQMMAVKKFYGKTSDNPLIHLMVCYDESVTGSEQACNLSRKIASFYDDDYQYYYCTHNKDNEFPHYHTHILINSVNYINGKLFNSGYENMQSFCKYVADVTGQKSRLIFF